MAAERIEEKMLQNRKKVKWPSPVDSELSLYKSKIAHDLLDSTEPKSFFFFLKQKKNRVVDCCSFSSQPALR